MSVTNHLRPSWDDPPSTSPTFWNSVGTVFSKKPWLFFQKGRGCHTPGFSGVRDVPSFRKLAHMLLGLLGTLRDNTYPCTDAQQQKRKGVIFWG